MQYDFDTAPDRRGTCSLKWEMEPCTLPMWVADMEFRTAPEIQEALVARAEHGVFGYCILPEEWYEAYRNWWKERHGWEIDRDWLLYAAGVMPTVSAVVRALTKPGDKVIVQTPVYHMFFKAITMNGAVVSENRLLREGDNYAMDFDDLEVKLADPRTKLLILCNPQNPTGDIWDAQTLGRLGEMCGRAKVPVLADEIHGDITKPGLHYAPYASVSDACRGTAIVCISPSKAFNVAGIPNAAVAVPYGPTRDVVRRALAVSGLAEPDDFGLTTSITAYTKGGPWLSAMCAYVEENKQWVRNFLHEHVPAIRDLPTAATYMMWLDCAQVTADSTDFAKELREVTGLFVSDGAQFRGDGRTFVRVNVACPRSMCEAGMRALAEFVPKYMEKRDLRSAGESGPHPQHLDAGK